MPLSPEIRKLLQQCLKIRNSEVPLHRVVDILATDEGDISQAVNRYRDIKNQDLRRSLHYLADLLRTLEKEAGLAPAWDPSTRSAASASPVSGAAPPAEKKAPAAPKPKFRPEELAPFEDDAARGNTPTAKVYVDGASKGNPGQSGIGIAMFALDGRKIAQVSRAIGETTNNVAEYTALIEALHLARRMGVQSLFVLSDSELMVKQMRGEYKIKNPALFQKAKEAQGLVRGFTKFRIDYIAREGNTLADALSTAQIPKPGKPPAAPRQQPSEDFMGDLPQDPDEGATE